MTDHYEDPDPGRVHFSPSLPAFGDDDRHVRIMSASIESPDSYAFATVKGELVIRHKQDAKTCIRAKFFEESRGVFVLSIQGYTVASEKPHNASFSFIGDEITKLYDLLHYVNTVEFSHRGSTVKTDDQLRETAVSAHQARRYLLDNEELIKEALKSEVTTADIVAVGYRRRQLEVFEKLLSEPDYFTEIQERKNTTPEGLWQRYFERNSWIFGYGLGYLFLSKLDDSKLEQVVQGYNLTLSGKRVDALMKTRGVISSICFVEIKTHETKLLEATAYRSGCWAPSRHLAGAVAQVHGTVNAAVETLTRKINPIDGEGNPTGEEIFNYQPRAFLVIGSLSEFVSEHGTNQEKLRSFELYRRSLSSPEIITFDELQERSRHIVQYNES